MRKCEYEDFIDDYLVNKLDGEEKEKFEEHYFNCHRCFEKMEERVELIAVVKSKGDVIFEEEKAEDRVQVFSFNKVFSFLTPKQWAFAAATAAVMLVIFLSVVPAWRKTSPHFVLDDKGVVRGETITLVSPVKDAEAQSLQFTWKKFGENVEYKVFLYSGRELLWTASTKETSFPLPEEIERTMQPGWTYSWQVKAFSAQGTLLAASSTVQFTIPAK